MYVAENRGEAGGAVPKFPANHALSTRLACPRKLTSLSAKLLQALHGVVPKAAQNLEQK